MTLTGASANSDIFGAGRLEMAWHGAIANAEVAEGKIGRLLIVRLSAMGDVIHTLPAVHALRAAFPQVYIGWLIEERWAELLYAPGSARRGPRSTLRPLVDEVHTVNLKTWRKSLWSISTVQRIATAWNDVRDGRYDVAVICKGRFGLRFWRAGRGQAWYTAPRSRENLPLACCTRGKPLHAGST